MSYEWLNLNDLAAEKVGGQVLYATDEFFGPASWLLKEGRGIFHRGRFTELGQYMEGWETRRHRYPDHDSCIIRLGLTGTIHGVDVDTNHFTGNHADAASIDAICADGDPSVEELKKMEWTEILPRQTLVPGWPDQGHNYFTINSDKRWTHIRLHNYPDGGISRLRVYGQVLPAWDQMAEDETINLLGIENGGRALASSNAHFSNKENLIMPGRGINMGDGWETRRRRGPGHDWAVLRFGCNGRIRRVLIDTAYFKGNFPAKASLEAAFVKDGESWEDAKWVEIVPKTPMFAHKEHFFKMEGKSAEEVFNHVRVNMFPDGGISRLKIFGRRVPGGDNPPAFTNTSGLATLETPPLTAEAFKKFGSVLEAQSDAAEANQGTAQRFNWLTQLENLRGEKAKPNVCVFRCKPRASPFEVKLLEKHPNSTQMFVPMNAKRYLVVVAEGNEKPDLSTIKAFIATGRQGVSYNAGVWHHPLVALDNETDFGCVVWEDGTAGDTVTVELDTQYLCRV